MDVKHEESLVFTFLTSGFTNCFLDKCFAVRKFTNQSGQVDTVSVLKVSNFCHYTNYKIKSHCEKTKILDRRNASAEFTNHE